MRKPWRPRRHVKTRLLSNVSAGLTCRRFALSRRQGRFALPRWRAEIERPQRRDLLAGNRDRCGVPRVDRQRRDGHGCLGGRRLPAAEALERRLVADPAVVEGRRAGGGGCRSHRGEILGSEGAGGEAEEVSGRVEPLYVDPDRARAEGQEHEGAGVAQVELERLPACGQPRLVVVGLDQGEARGLLPQVRRQDLPQGPARGDPSPPRFGVQDPARPGALFGRKAVRLGPNGVQVGAPDVDLAAGGGWRWGSSLGRDG